MRWFKSLLKRGSSDLPVNLSVTLWPAFSHFPRFSRDMRIQGIRLNSAMMAAAEIDGSFESHCRRSRVPLWFDIKGMQLRIREIVCDENHDHLEFILNRPIQCNTPCPVWFKAGEDCAELAEIRDGTHLIFNGGPRNIVKTGESIHIRNPELIVEGPTFLDYEVEKIERVKSLGFTNYYLSYVYSQKHLDEFQELVGKDAQIRLKIENKDGLKFVETEFRSKSNVHLVAARGDLFIEIDRPHEILGACKLIIAKDRGAVVGSRMLLSLVNGLGVPNCSDLNELAWLYDIGYREFLLCDELCLKENLLAHAVNVFEAFRSDYCYKEGL